MPCTAQAWSSTNVNIRPLGSTWGAPQPMHEPFSARLQLFWNSLPLKIPISSCLTYFNLFKSQLKSEMVKTHLFLAAFQWSCLVSWVYIHISSSINCMFVEFVERMSWWRDSYTYRYDLSIVLNFVIVVVFIGWWWWWGVVFFFFLGGGAFFWYKHRKITSISSSSSSTNLQRFDPKDSEKAWCCPTLTLKKPSWRTWPNFVCAVSVSLVNGAFLLDPFSALLMVLFYLILSLPLGRRVIIMTSLAKCYRHLLTTCCTTVPFNSIFILVNSYVKESSRKQQLWTAKPFLLRSQKMHRNA